MPLMSPVFKQLAEDGRISQKEYRNFAKSELAMYMLLCCAICLVVWLLLCVVCREFIEAMPWLFSATGFFLACLGWWPDVESQE